MNAPYYSQNSMSFLQSGIQKINPMRTAFKFIPLSSSWVAIHPKPKGVIQFIGGAFFGSFPTLFYRYFLSQLFADGYTIIALPFRFSFQHWSIAIALLNEQSILQREIPKEARKLGYDDSIYADATHYFWVGHSLGCKYIALLEFLSEGDWRDKLRQCVDSQEVELVERVFDRINPGKTSILNQPSLLIAPDISNTESAVPIRALARLLDWLGLGVTPKRKQTQCFIQLSNLFNLTAMISFTQDTVAGSLTDSTKSPEIQAESDVLWFAKQLQDRDLINKEIPGKHLEPVGIRVGNYIVDLNPLDKFIEFISSRCLEQVALQLLEKLERREEGLELDAIQSVVKLTETLPKAEDNTLIPLPQTSG